MKHFTGFGALLLAIAANPISAIELNVLDPGSIRSVARTVAYGLVSYYTGNVTNTPETIAILPPPHYWWQAGAMWGLLIDYFQYTDDPTYNSITMQALISQVGPNNDYMMPLYQYQEANDDQAFWGFSTMSAAEKGFPQPPGQYTWLQLTENLWNTQVRRWDTTTCGGGLKWQIFDFNKGYFYKNSVSNGAFFQLSARLARYTKNQTYTDWAEKSWEWSESVGLISPSKQVFDGTNSLLDCHETNHIEWSYNSGIYLYGAAMLYNLTNGGDLWFGRTQGLLNAAGFFFSPYANSTDIMYEYACEPIETCNYDQYSFKGYLARFMWATTIVAPFTKDTITTLLRASAAAAAKSCSGGRDGVTCGAKWYTGGWDGTYGAGQQMSALETIQGLLVQHAPPLIHAGTVDVEPVSAPLLPPLRTTTAPSSEPPYVAPTTSTKQPATTKVPEPTRIEHTSISASEKPILEPTRSSTSAEPTQEWTPVPEVTSSSTSEELMTVEPSTTSTSETPTPKPVTTSTTSEPEPTTISTITLVETTTSETATSPSVPRSTKTEQTREELTVASNTGVAASPTIAPPESQTQEAGTKISTGTVPSTTKKSMGGRASIAWGSLIGFATFSMIYLF